MEQIELQANLRNRTGKGEAHKLRREKKIPAIFYGKNKENILLSVDPFQLEKAIANPSGMNTIIQLKVDGVGNYPVLLRDYQADPIKRNFTHADFVFVDLSKKIQVAIPVHLTGTPQGVKEGGILQQVTREIEVLCLPTNIPKQFDVDVSALKIGDNLHLHDIKLPEGVEAIAVDDSTIASVIAVKEEEVAAPAVMTEPEVLTAKKEEGAAEGGEEKKAEGEAKEGKAKEGKK